jgi:hypothetical protein
MGEFTPKLSPSDTEEVTAPMEEVTAPMLEAIDCSWEWGDEDNTNWHGLILLAGKLRYARGCKGTLDLIERIRKNLLNESHQQLFEVAIRIAAMTDILTRDPDLVHGVEEQYGVVGVTEEIKKLYLH